MRIRRNLTYLLVAGLVLALSAPVLGQSPSGQSENFVGNPEADIERANELIERAEDAVRVSNSVRGQLLLEGAKNLRDQAESELVAGSMRQAAILAREALDQAKKALAAARSTQQKQDAVLRKLERADQLLDRTREEQSLSENGRLAKVFESAENNLRLAWEFYRDGEYIPSLKLVNQVDNALQRLIGVVNRQQRGSAGVDRFADGVDEFLESTTQKLADCSSETAIKLMEEARSTFETALGLAEEDQSAAAMEALQTAKNLATRARLECGAFDGTLSERYDRIKGQADEISESLSADDTAARELLDEVYSQLELAQGFIDSGDTKAAAASIKAAQLTLNQVIKLLDVSTD